MTDIRTGPGLAIDAIEVHLALVPRLDDGRVHVEGVAEAGDGTTTSFSGWTALVGLLETLVEGSLASSPRPDGTAPGSH